jgi:predicted esterase
MVMLLSGLLWAQEDVADVPSERLQANDDPQKSYFLIGPYKDAPRPEGGYRLLLILPGGDGSADFHPFCKRIYKYALTSDYLVAQLVAPKWSDDQFEKLVWPTRANPWSTAEFTTEEFVEAVIADVKKRYPIDARYVFALGWSSGGPPVYSVALQEKTPLRGAFIAMSVFKPNQLPPLKNANGRCFYILHSPEDFIPIRMAEQAEQQLSENGARVQFATYEGGHGWRGDVYGNIQAGIRWLESQAVKPPPKAAPKKDKAAPKKGKPSSAQAKPASRKKSAIALIPIARAEFTFATLLQVPPASRGEPRFPLPAGGTSRRGSA